MSFISEKDLYMFIFYPELLEDKKIEYITLNIGQFKTELNLLNAIKENLNKPVDESIIAKIQEKLSFTHQKLFNLKKIVVKNEPDQLVLAADSKTVNKKTSTETFWDEGKNFLVKIISDNECNKIFVFPSKENLITEYRLTLLPSEQSIYINIDDLPIIVKPKQIVDQIQISEN